MKENSTYDYNPVKHHVVSVPKNIKVAKVEILTFRGAPTFLGTMLAKLCFDGESIIIYSKICGVVDRILVENDDIVSCGQELFELRNTNVSRRKSGNKSGPSNSPTPKPYCNFFRKEKDDIEEMLDLRMFNKLHQ